jgi:NitT/TauT family transport system substrate-binding protein
VARKFLTGIDKALKDIHANPAGAVETGLKLFPGLKPAVVKESVERLIADKVFAETIAIAPEAMRAALQTQVDLGNLAAIPEAATYLNLDWANEIAKAAQ